MDITPDGGVEIDADRLVDLVLQSIDQLIALIPQRCSDSSESSYIQSSIAAVAGCTFWHNLMGVDENGDAATPVFSWNDTRSAAAAGELKALVDEQDLHARTGCVLHASYWPAKLFWLRSTRPELFASVRRWMSIGEYLFLRLFGKLACSVSMASATGVFNQNRCTWDHTILSQLKVDPEKLSELVDSDFQFTELVGEYAERWPALKKVGWYPLLGDGACGNVGSGCITPDRAALNIGTSGALRVAWEAQATIIPRGLWCYRVDRKRFVMGGALSNGGDLFAWMKDTLNLGSVDDLEGQLPSMAPDSHGLTILPFLSGERSTGWASEARGAITGLSLDTEPIEILQAGLEAVAYRFGAIYDLISAQIGEPSRVIGSGAAVLRSPSWVQIISDVIGKQVIASAESETSSRGAALMALEALGAISSIEEVEISLGRTYSPDLQNHSVYSEARRRQDRLYELIIPTYSV
jgi:gluconokinase